MKNPFRFFIVIISLFISTWVYAETNTPAYNQHAASQVTQSFDKKNQEAAEKNEPNDGIKIDIKKWLPWLLVFAGFANIMMLYSRIKDRKLAEMRKKKREAEKHPPTTAPHPEGQTTALHSSTHHNHIQDHHNKNI